MLKYYLLIQSIFENVLNLFLVFLYLLRPSFYSFRLTHKKSIIILGNGPSLKDDFEKIITQQIEEDADLLVVNDFASTKEFKEIKPNFYFLADPSYFVNTDDTRILSIRDSLIKSLKCDVSWKLKLFLPVKAKKSTFSKLVRENNNIEIYYYYNNPIVGGFSRINYLYYKFNLANPLFQNVLIGAIFFAIKSNYKKIFIYGADHSWHENLSLGKDNCIYIVDKHFYDFGIDANISTFKHSDINGNPLTMYDEFSTLARAFRIYHDLAYFAKKCNCIIINKSSKTWIDAFQRD